MAIAKLLLESEGRTIEERLPNARGRIMVGHRVYEMSHRGSDIILYRFGIETNLLGQSLLLPRLIAKIPQGEEYTISQVGSLRWRVVHSLSNKSPIKSS